MHRTLAILLAGLALSGCLAQDEQTTERTSVQSIEGACRDSWERQGWCDNLEDGIRIHDTTIDAGKTGLSILSGPQVHLENLEIHGHVTIVAAHCPCNVTLQDVVASGEGETGLSLGILAPPGAKADATLERTAASGFDTAIKIKRFATVTVVDSTLACRIQGLELGSAHLATLSNVTVRGCSQQAIHLPSVDRLVATDLEVTDASVGIDARSATRGSIEGLVLENNRLGMEWAGGSLQGSGWLVSNNGQRGGTTGDEPRGGVRLALAGSTVHDSHFDGNEPTAVTSYPGSVDYRKNWWGHVDGASLHISEGLPRTAGDAVSKEVDAGQHLSAPP